MCDDGQRLSDHRFDRFDELPVVDKSRKKYLLWSDRAVALLKFIRFSMRSDPFLSFSDSRGEYFNP